MRKSLLGIATSAALAAATLAPTTADAHCRGCGLGFGIAGGLIAGALIGGALASPYYYGGGPYYGGPVYYGGGPYYAYGGGCWWQRERYWDGWGWRVQRVRVCR